jgi:hypothetical protein
MLELEEDTIPLSSSQVEWMAARINANIMSEIKEVTSLLVARVDTRRGVLVLVGTVPSMKSAKLMFATQLEYIDKTAIVEEAEKTARSQLTTVQKR